MSDLIKSSAQLISRCYALARPYGLGKLLLVLSFSLAQGIFQVLGVTSIFPFLALAADPGRLRNSRIGSKFLEIFPPMDDTRLLIAAGIFALVMLFLSNGMNLAAEYVRTRYAHQFGHWLRVRLLRKIASRPYADFLQQNSSLLVKKVVGDVSAFTGGVLLPLLDTLARFATIVLLIGTLFLVQPQIAILASLGFGIFYLAIFRGFQKRLNAISHGLKESFSGICFEAQQMLAGIKSVKIHRAEEVFLDRFHRHSERNAALQSIAPMLASCPRYLVEPVAFGGLVLVVLVYSVRGESVVSILPNLGVLALAAYRLLPTFQLLYGQITGLATQRHALDEVFDEFLSAERATGKDAETHDGRLSVPAALRWSQEIRLENLTFRYPGSEKPVIENLSLSILKNSSLGIVGTTGCGKSTLVDLILGLHIPTSGRILVDGTPLGPENRRAWRGGIGYVPQEIFLIDDSVAANIALGVRAEKIDASALRRSAEAAQILAFIENELPHGFATVVGERGVRLSGGQRQRIGLARALYHQPELLVLDEATSALDIATEDGVMKAIADLSGKITMLVIAHRLRTVEMCETKLDMANPPGFCNG
jgi:ABC-type multidrug transport system fused ATPase/permease subunit